MDASTGFVGLRSGGAGAGGGHVPTADSQTDKRHRQHAGDIPGSIKWLEKDGPRRSIFPVRLISFQNGTLKFG
jgi:hypothetical protein